ncbi:Rieske (2Fe-2S) protein [Phenylobacterium deserti]|uniref:Rieske (2Fe-2S) protein n=1 Tax=Phenylobacterium deserti TaxID=1914756 RepID=UPI001F0CC67D|nr:Rieske (2Fe-2S) protein [Phenylobacterium deserti]
MRLCALDELAEPGSKGFRFRHENRLFAGFLVRAGGTVRGFVDSCPHAGWPLSALDDRYLTRDGGHILCAGHGALFDLDGLGVTSPCAGERLTDWPVEIRDGEVFTA